MKRSFWLVIIGWLAIHWMPTHAQTVSNLIQNPGFESDQYTNMTASADGSAYYNVPAPWYGAVDPTPGAQPWLNVMPNGYPHEGGFVLNGRRSYHVARGGGTFTAWFYQTVATVPNTDLQGGAWALLEKTNGGGLVRAGIDPNGGTNPFASSVVWSDWGSATYQWIQVSVSTKAKGNLATLFLYMTQTVPSDPNGVYWDDAFLNGIGGASIVPAPPLNNQPTGQVVNANTTVNVRASASTTATRLGKIFPGTFYSVLGQEGEWVVIDYNGQTGYVSSRYVSLSTGSATNTTAISASTSTVTFLAQYTVNVRTEPNATASRMGRLANGQSATVIGKSSDGQWAQLDSGGWVAVRFGQLSGNLDTLPIK